MLGRVRARAPHQPGLWSKLAPVPAPPVLPSSGRVAISGTFGPALWSNIFHYKTVESGTPTAADLADLNADLLTGFGVEFAPNLSTNWSTVQIENVYYPVAGGELVSALSAAHVGTDSGVDLPAAAAMVINWQIPSHYRGGHPRTYLCGLVQDRMQDSQDWSAATISDFETAAAAWLAAFNTHTTTHFSSVTMGTLRRFANGGSETKPDPTYLNPPVFYAIASSSVRVKIGNQRRRNTN